MSLYSLILPQLVTYCMSCIMKSWVSFISHTDVCFWAQRQQAPTVKRGVVVFFVRCVCLLCMLPAIRRGDRTAVGKRWVKGCSLWLDHWLNWKGLCLHFYMCRQGSAETRQIDSSPWEIWEGSCTCSSCLIIQLQKFFSRPAEGMWNSDSVGPVTQVVLSCPKETKFLGVRCSLKCRAVPVTQQ